MRIPRPRLDLPRRPAHRWRVMILGVAVAVLAAACGGGTGDRPQVVADSELPTAAKTEGTVVWYSSLPEQYSKVIADAFTEKYDVNVDLFVTGSLGLQNKIAEEIKAQKLAADVFHSSSAQLRADEAAGAVAKYESPEYKSYPPEYVDPDKTYGTFRATAVVIAYNPNALDGRPVPTRWEDLTNPQYRDMIAAADPKYGGTQLVADHLLAEKYGDDFLRQLGAQQPQLVDSQTAEANLIITGERAIGIDMNDYEAWASKYNRKAPIDYVYPQDHVTVVPGYLRHPRRGTTPERRPAVPELPALRRSAATGPGQGGCLLHPHRRQADRGTARVSSLPVTQPDWQELGQNTTEIQDKLSALLHQS